MVTSLPKSAISGLTTSDSPVFAGINVGEDTLSVYDEGTWTPVMKIGTTTISTGTPVGKHIKIGKQVTVWFSIPFNRGTNTGNVTVTGLPFASTQDAPGTVILNDYVDGSPPIIPSANSGGTVIAFYVLPLTTETQLANMTDAQIKASTASTLYGTITYYAS